MNTFRRFKLSRPLLCLMLALSAVVLPASPAFDRQLDSQNDQPLFALAEKVREKRQTAKIGGDVAVRLRLRDREEEIPAHAQLVTDYATRRKYAIAVTHTNDIILVFSSGSSAAYFCLTDVSGKLRWFFRAEPGKEDTFPEVSAVRHMVEEQIGFWKTYFGIAE